MNKNNKYRIMVICAPGESQRVYGFYLNYTLKEVTNICNNFPVSWSYTINNEN
jgi:hypothetical protein